MPRQRRWQLVKAFKGLCLRCGKPVAIKYNGNKARLCPIHLEYVAAAVRQHRLRSFVR
jgi:hypothetical protein